MEYVTVTHSNRPEVLQTIRLMAQTRELIEVLQFHHKSGPKTKSLALANEILAMLDSLRVQLDNRPRVPVIGRIRRLLSSRF